MSSVLLGELLDLRSDEYFKIVNHKVQQAAHGPIIEEVLYGYAMEKRKQPIIITVEDLDAAFKRILPEGAVFGGTWQDFVDWQQHNYRVCFMGAGLPSWTETAEGCLMPQCELILRTGEQKASIERVKE